MHGATAVLRIDYHYTVPKDPWGGRTGWMDSPDGPIYSVAQWYPRMAVYDDIRGWDPLPYLAQEFYLEYGDFDYSVTVPANWIVAGSGGLVNEAEVLSRAAARAAGAGARRSDKTVMIRAASEPFGSPSGTKTWHFTMHNSRDVAFAASPAFVWDAARIDLPGGKTRSPMSVYPPEAKAWDRSTEYIKDAVEHYSAQMVPLSRGPPRSTSPARRAEWNIRASSFDDINSPPKVTFWVAAHEIGHSWFPMIVGFNERRDAWMDEGFNTFIDVYESDEFNHGEYAPKRDSEYAPKGGNPVDEILPHPRRSRCAADPLARRHGGREIAAPGHLFQIGARPGALARADPRPRAVRPGVPRLHRRLGVQASDAGRFLPLHGQLHRRGSELVVERLVRAQLAARPRGHRHQAVPGRRTPLKGSLVTVEARDKLVMPVTLRVTFADGTTRDMRLPAETWIRQASTDVPIVGNSPVVRAVLDPDHKIPDKDRSNNDFRVQLTATIRIGVYRWIL